MKKIDIVIVIFLLGGFFLLTSCDFTKVELPTPMDEEPSWEGSPKAWGSGEPILDDGTTPGPAWKPYGESIAIPITPQIVPLPPVQPTETEEEAIDKQAVDLYTPWMIDDEGDVRDYIPDAPGPDHEGDDECEDETK